MKIDRLRQLVIDYNKFNLPVEKRKFIQKEIGYSKASELVKELDFFIKSEECKLVVSPMSIEKYNDKNFLNLYIILGRTNSLFRVFSELEVKNLQNTLTALKKIKNIRLNKTENSLLNQEINSDYKIEKITYKEILEIKNKWKAKDFEISEPEPNLNYYKINENNNPVAFFTSNEDNLEIEFADFMVDPNKRKTKSMIDILKIMKQFVKTDKTASCAALTSQPELVKMYEKLGFELQGIYSESNIERQELITAYTMIKPK